MTVMLFYMTENFASSGGVRTLQRIAKEPCMEIRVLRYFLTVVRE